MAWKGLHLSRPAYLHIERGSLCIEFRDDLEPAQFRLPVEDLGWLILDHPQVSLSTHLLCRCSESGVLVLGSGHNHLPVWASLPWTQFHRQGEVLALQLGLSLPLKKRLWQETVRRKILAQSHSLRCLDSPHADTLALLAGQVRSGDPDNLEARAAQLYFKRLFSKRDFVRHSSDLPNAMLNYGYAIIRGVLARHLCAVGFMPQLGIHHCSQSNAYNLADDLIEPYRPVVDHSVALAVASRASDEEIQLADRRALAALLEREVDYAGESVTLFQALNQTVASLKLAMQDEDCRLLNFGTLRV